MHSKVAPLCSSKKILPGLILFQIWNKKMHRIETAQLQTIQEQFMRLVQKVLCANRQRTKHSCYDFTMPR